MVLFPAPQPISRTRWMIGVEAIAAAVISSIAKGASKVAAWPVSRFENRSTSLLKRLSITEGVDFSWRGVVIVLIWYCDVGCGTG